MEHIPLAALIYRIHLAWQLDSVFYSFLMTRNGASMRQKIRNATYAYIEKAAPKQPRRYTHSTSLTDAGDIYPADAIIYATGFQTQRWLHPLTVKGTNGKDLHETWAASDGAEAYKETVVIDFPVFFILYGLKEATGQHSVIFHS
ncbi:uncharacterized protein BDV17DRAFT_287376 [Aspergillus undulatus]|uniref:uncharacterized protein n=1 Tax=Aspergillus undulatus TaxID=1810928 RepID=UPI003CCCDDAD